MLGSALRAPEGAFPAGKVPPDVGSGLVSIDVMRVASHVSMQNWTFHCRSGGIAADPEENRQGQELTVRRRVSWLLSSARVLRRIGRPASTLDW